MSEQITKDDLADFTESIINEIDSRLRAMEIRMDAKYAKEKTIGELELKSSLRGA